MKNKLKKSKTREKTPKKEKQKRGDVRYLGFVVSSELPPLDAVTHALVNFDDAPDTWYVIELSSDSYEAETKASVPRYFHAVFVAATTAMLQNKRHQLKYKAVILEKHVTQYAKIASNLRNWARPDKIKSASHDFPKLRMAIHRSLFAARGTRKPLEVVWKGKPNPDAVFFWKPESLQKLNLNLQSGEPFQTVTIKELSPKSEWAPESLAELAWSLVLEEYGCSWRDLYREALVKSMRVHDFIELSALSRVDPVKTLEQDTPNLPPISLAQSNITKNAVNALQILQDNHKVMLSGPSGSGKTTTLRHMAWQFAAGMQKIRGRWILPLFVPMKWFGLWPQNTENPPRLSAYLAF